MRIKPQKIDLQGLSPAAGSLLQVRPTRLFSKRHPGAAHDLLVLVETVARHSFFIANTFNRSGSKRRRDQHEAISKKATLAFNELAALHKEMSALGKEGKKVEGEWPVFKTSALGKPSNKSWPQFLAKDIEANINCLFNQLTVADEKLIEDRTQAIQHAAAAVDALKSMTQEMDRVMLESGFMLKWPPPCRTKRSDAA
jgi:hypothetical protein